MKRKLNPETLLGLALLVAAPCGRGTEEREPPPSTLGTPCTKDTEAATCIGVPSNQICFRSDFATPPKMVCCERECGQCEICGADGRCKNDAEAANTAGVCGQGTFTCMKRSCGSQADCQDTEQAEPRGTPCGPVGICQKSGKYKQAEGTCANGVCTATTADENAVELPCPVEKNLRCNKNCTADAPCRLPGDKADSAADKKVCPDSCRVDSDCLSAGVEYLRFRSFPDRQLKSDAGLCSFSGGAEGKCLKSADEAKIVADSCHNLFYEFHGVKPTDESTRMAPYSVFVCVESVSSPSVKIYYLLWRALSLPPRDALFLGRLISTDGSTVEGMVELELLWGSKVILLREDLHKDAVAAFDKKRLHEKAKAAPRFTLENFRIGPMQDVSFIPLDDEWNLGVWPNIRLVDVSYWGQIYFTLGKLELIRVTGIATHEDNMGMDITSALKIEPLAAEDSSGKEIALLGELTVNNSILEGKDGITGAIELSIADIADAPPSANVTFEDMTLLPTVDCKDTESSAGGYSDATARAKEHRYTFKNVLMQKKPVTEAWAKDAASSTGNHSCAGVVSLAQGEAARDIAHVALDKYVCDQASKDSFPNDCQSKIGYKVTDEATRLDVERKKRPGKEKEDHFGAFAKQAN